MRKSVLIAINLLFSALALTAQEDLLSLLNEEEETEYVSASFKTNRVINLQSLENTAPGVLDIKIGHRFGFINQGAYELFGLDNATIRIGADLGLTNRLMVGFGRSSFEKTYDGFLKYRLIRQSTGKRKMPFSVSVMASTAIRSEKPRDPDRENYFSSRMFYTFQLILGSKISEGFSIQVSPTLVHRNLVSTLEEENDVIAIAAAARQKLTKRLSLNVEYIYVLPDQILDSNENSLSIGFDIETGGHVFQLHFTNSTSMIDKGFVAETTGNWLDGDIHFGFNISRVFTLWGREE
ncbi:MAG TPA: DUF5777 family beta-barrel protein [Saprospiraceae bacterium]|nr:DUF5777 family beta-barrel protein [Saprospiraceae bacterium]